MEKRIKESKAELKTLTDELEHKLQLKRLGGDEFKAESQQLLRRWTPGSPRSMRDKKEEKKKITALQKDKAALQARMAKTDALLASIGGQLTEAEAKTLILKKLYDSRIRNSIATSMPKSGGSFKRWKTSGTNTPSPVAILNPNEAKPSRRWMDFSTELGYS